jgi:hypothetical protein
VIHHSDCASTRVIRFAFLGVAWISAAHAANISIFAEGGGLTGVNTRIENPVSGQHLIYQQIAGGIFSDRPYSLTEISLDASPGVLRAGVSSYAGNPDPDLFAGSGAGGDFAVRATDEITLGGGPASGFLSLDVLMEGSTLLDVLSTGGYDEADARFFLDYDIGTTRMLSIRDDADLLRPFDEVTVRSEISRIGRVLIPFNGTSLQVLQTIIGSYRCGAGRLEICQEAGNFGDTFQLGGAVVLDSAGNAVNGVSITSSTGYDYTQALTLTSVPEPTTWRIMGATLGVLLLHLRRRAASPRNR